MHMCFWPTLFDWPLSTSHDMSSFCLQKQTKWLAFLLFSVEVPVGLVTFIYFINFISLSIAQSIFYLYSQYFISSFISHFITITSPFCKQILKFQFNFNIPEHNLTQTLQAFLQDCSNALDCQQYCNLWRWLIVIIISTKKRKNK